MEIFPKDIQYIIAGYLNNYNELDNNLIINLYTSRSSKTHTKNTPMLLGDFKKELDYCGLFYPRIAYGITPHNLLYEAIKYNNIVLAEYITRNGNIVEEDILSAAILSDNINNVNWVLQKRNGFVYRSEKLFPWCQSLKMTKFIFNSKIGIAFRRNTIGIAFPMNTTDETVYRLLERKINNTEIIKIIEFLLNHIELTEESYIHAANSGNLQIMKYLHKKKKMTCATIFNNAIYSGNMEMLVWMKTVGYEWNWFSYVEAANNDNLNILKWLHVSGCPWDNDTFAEITSFPCYYRFRPNHKKIISYLISNNCPRDYRALLGVLKNIEYIRNKYS